MGASNDNLDEVLKTDPKTVGAVKIFMNSSTGNMLVDNRSVLEEIFAKSPMLIAVHCEDESTIQTNTEKYKSTIWKIYPLNIIPRLEVQKLVTSRQTWQ